MKMMKSILSFLLLAPIGVSSRFDQFLDTPLPSPDAPVLAGYDLVAYHSLDPNADGVLGSLDFSYRYDGYLYYFANDANRELFKQDPETYLPAYGGFCAWGVAWEYENEGWPWAADHMGPPCGPRDGWAILDGRLYCSIFRWYQDDFNEKSVEGIRLANQRWIEWYGSLNAGPKNHGCYAWNWQECFARSIHNSLDQVGGEAPAPSEGNLLEPPTVSPVPAEDALPEFDEEPKIVWSQDQSSLEGLVTWRWTLQEVTSETPSLIVEMDVMEVAEDDYVAFGVAEQLMQGPLVACSDVIDGCKTIVGNGMGTTVPTTDPVQVKVLTSSRNETHYSVRFDASLLGFTATPRSPARVLFARGSMAGDGSPQPHPNTPSYRKATSGIDFLSVIEGYDVQANRPPPAPAPAELDSLPDMSDLQNVEGTAGTLNVLEGRIRIDYELHTTPDEEEIVTVTLQGVAVAEESYVGFGFAKDTMSGLILTCSMDENGSLSDRACKQWRGRGTNLWPRSRDDAGGWHVQSIDSDGTLANFTLAGRVLDIVEAQGGSGRLQPENLRAIVAVGISPADSGNPLQHRPMDRAAFEILGLSSISSAVTASNVLQDSSDDEKNVGLIVGASVAGAVGFCLVCLFVGLFCSRNASENKPVAMESGDYKQGSDELDTQKQHASDGSQDLESDTHKHHGSDGSQDLESDE